MSIYLNSLRKKTVSSMLVVCNHCFGGVMAVQLELFCDNDETSILRRRIDAMQDSMDRQRKRQFAMINDLSKELIALKEELHRVKFRIQ